MASDRENLERETLGQLADRMQDGPNAPRHYYSALAELERAVFGLNRGGIPESGRF
jgi:hypothetical protein